MSDFDYQSFIDCANGCGRLELPAHKCPHCGGPIKHVYEDMPPVRRFDSVRTRPIKNTCTHIGVKFSTVRVCGITVKVCPRCGEGV